MLLIVGAIVVAVLGIFFVMNGGLVQTPPRPEIKYGEFPFRLEYEINGQVVVVEDTIICKYKGVGYGISINKKYLKWESCLASGKEIPWDKQVSLLIDEANQIYLYLREASYYLGAQDDDNEWSPVAWSPLIIGIISTDELWDKYNIRIISFEPSPPIENTFK